MSKLVYYKWTYCPYCQQADSWIKELMDENPKYRDIEFDVRDENTGDFNDPGFEHEYVPSFFLNGKKLHDGAATRDKIRAVLDAAVGK